MTINKKTNPNDFAVGIADYSSHEGLTKREWMATMILAGNAKRRQEVGCE